MFTLKSKDGKRHRMERHVAGHEKDASASEMRQHQSEVLSGWVHAQVTRYTHVLRKTKKQTTNPQALRQSPRKGSPKSDRSSLTVRPQPSSRDLTPSCVFQNISNIFPCLSLSAEDLLPSILFVELQTHAVSLSSFDHPFHGEHRIPVIHEVLPLGVVTLGGSPFFPITSQATASFWKLLRNCS